MAQLKKRAQTGHYRDVQQYKEDWLLMFRNARMTMMLPIVDLCALGTQAWLKNEGRPYIASTSPFSSPEILNMFVNARHSTLVASMTIEGLRGCCSGRRSPYTGGYGSRSRLPTVPVWKHCISAYACESFHTRLINRTVVICTFNRLSPGLVTPEEFWSIP